MQEPALHSCKKDERELSCCSYIGSPVSSAVSLLCRYGAVAGSSLSGCGFCG